MSWCNMLRLMTSTAERVVVVAMLYEKVVLVLCFKFVDTIAPTGPVY